MDKKRFRVIFLFVPCGNHCLCLPCL